MSSRFERAYRVDGTTTFNAAFWNRILRDLDTRIVGIEGKKADFEEAEKTLLDLGLRRINETLLPAAEKIFRVAELGFLVASSDEAATLIEGEDASLTIREGDQRDLFTPSPFIALTRRTTIADYAIARTIAYDPETGVLLFNVETVVGNGGPHDDWDVAALAGSVAAMVASLDETRTLRQAVADDKAEATSARNAAQTARNQAVSAKDDAQAARTGAENALNSFLTVYRGALPSAPAGGAQGHFYFDTTLQQARVYTAAGWAPLFSVSLGGIRQDVIEAEDGQTVFTVEGGGFTYINVFKNGVLLTAGDDYTTASPNFTLTSSAAEGDVIAYHAYYATEQTDFYTKEVADGRFVRLDDDQGLDPAEQRQARENIGAASPFRAAYGGTADAITLVDDGPLVAGRLVRFRAASPNTGAATIAYNGGSAIACRTISGTVLPPGYIRTDVDTVAIYDGAHWVLDREVERGSNANGEYVRFADGTQFCTGTIPYSGASSAAGSIFGSAPINPTPPAAFTELQGGWAGDNSSVNSWGVMNQSGGQLRMFSYQSTSGAREARYFMFGRWY